jgi:hypothetical protein
MRFYTTPHPFYCGLDLHARIMYVCILSQDGAMGLHRHLPAGPEPLLKASAPSREALVVWVACLCPWSWLAARCAREGMPGVLGPALSLKAIHGGKAKHAQSDAPKIAVLLRGGRRPHAYVDPAARRATRALLRRRMPRVRQRAALVPPGQPPHWPYHVPAMGKTIAYKTHRTGGAERWPAPAVAQSSAVDRALRADAAQVLRALAWAMVTTAPPQAAHPLYWLQTVPGMGHSRRLVLWSALHALARFPRVPAGVSSCWRGHCAKASAGQRDGTSGTKSGPAALTWAFSAAALLGRRPKPAGQQSLARLEQQPGKSTALTVWAQQLARAVDALWQRRGACALQPLRQSVGRGAGEPAASRGHDGGSLVPVLCTAALLASPNAPEHSGAFPCPGALAGTPARAPGIGVNVLMVRVCCPSPAPEPHWRTPMCSPSCAEDGMRVQSRF